MPVDLAACRIDFHEHSTINSGCQEGVLDTIYIDASVGVNDLGETECKEQDMMVSGSKTKLYVTIQAAGCQQAGEEPLWRVCSWQPADICGDLSCCNSVGESFESDSPYREKSCQDLETGDCMEFLGFDGNSPQLFAIELVSCTGNLPVDPSCQQNTGALLASAGTDGASSHVRTQNVSIGILSAGVLFIVLGFTMRRKRQQLTRGYAKVEVTQKEPSERSPLWKEAASVVGLYANDTPLSTLVPEPVTPPHAKDPYLNPSDLRAMLVSPQRAQAAAEQSWESSSEDEVSESTSLRGGNRRNPTLTSL